MIRRPPRSTPLYSSAASDVYKRQERGQTLMLRISPYEKSKEKDVPDWYREMVGEEEGLEGKHWNVDPENPLYVKYFGGMIKALGQRYDGHPYLESVDVSFI